MAHICSDCDSTTESEDEDDWSDGAGEVWQAQQLGHKGVRRDMCEHIH